jgi:hypothetical protein
MPVFMIEIIKSKKAAYGREITVAVVLKFFLLIGLWWLFFKGHKQSVDGDIIAAKFFSVDRPPVTQIEKSLENP